MDREIPKSDHDLLISLWTFLIGVNGGGFISKFDAFAEKTDIRLDTLEKLIPTLWTRDDHERAEKEYAEKDKAKAVAVKDKRDTVERRKMSAREIWMLVAAFLGSFAGLGGVIVAIIALGGTT